MYCGYGMGYDPMYLLLIVVSTILGMATQGYIKSTYAKWSKVPLDSSLTGADVARRMLADEGVSGVGIEAIGGELTDNYDPRSNVLHLSQGNLRGGSVASAAVACHEAGHAVQHARGYVPVRIRSALVPVVNFTSNAWMIVFFLGIAMGAAGLTRFAIVLFAFSVIFQIVTLPVEFDASRRAVAYVERSGLGPQAVRGAKKVLVAAALTYVAAALVSVLQLSLQDRPQGRALMAWTSVDTRGARSVTDVVGGSDALSVTAAVGAAGACVKKLGPMLVTGEVTGFRGPNARSGHCYFEVKDDSSVMSVKVWKGIYAKSGVALKDGLQLEMWGSFDVYSGNGELSFIAKRISVAGEGPLQRQVEALRAKLKAEGLADPARKRPIPRFCTRVAVIGSISGEVIDDVKRTLLRRNKLVEIQVVGARIQGVGAPEDIIRALGIAAAARPDAILLVRGGGSYEELMTFSDESLCRAVAACPVPVITGIGHEPDCPIVDDVSDRRASTPTGAAESVAPALDEIVGSINTRRERLSRAMDVILEQHARAIGQQGLLMQRSMSSRISHESLRVESLASRRCLSDPMTIVSDRETSLLQVEQRLLDALPRSLERKGRELDSLASRLSGVGPRIVRPYEARVGSLAATLDALSPLKVLGRGYAIARDADGHVVTNASALAPGDAVSVRLGEGSFEAAVTGVSK